MITRSTKQFCWKNLTHFTNLNSFEYQLPKHSFESQLTKVVEFQYFVRKYSIVISDKLVGSFLDVLFLLLAVILSELYEKPRRKRLSSRKKYRKEFVRNSRTCFLYISQNVSYYFWMIGPDSRWKLI